MLVKLITDLFITQTYDLNVTADSLVFSSSQQDPIQIDFPDLRHFNIAGKGKNLKHFILETSTRSYEGQFFHDEDANQLIHQLQKICGCYMDVRMDMES